MKEQRAIACDVQWADNGPDRTGLPVTPRLAFADQCRACWADNP